MKTLFEKIRNLKIPYANHESDLYIPKTKITEKLIDKYEHKEIVSTFINQQDNKLWFDVPFAYDIYWIKKQ